MMVIYFFLASGFNSTNKQIIESTKLAPNTVTSIIDDIYLLMEGDLKLEDMTIGTWNGIKIRVGARYRTEKQMPWELVEFIWRRKHSSNLWQAFITALKEISFGDITSPSNSSTSNNNKNNTSNTSDGPVPQFTQVVLIENNSSTTEEENAIEPEPSSPSSSSSSSESDDDDYQNTHLIHRYLQVLKRSLY
ncbi:hypothetical protein INT45_006034 [Circinella minor]|uniref:Uncharacterized protein n=1 Tax=Circinella minor TaxID=1195481 RepID=A0A8H7V868_9FUNG|nr:hypothetical protein INT45_006034 [Circinella minor]